MNITGFTVDQFLGVLTQVPKAHNFIQFIPGRCAAGWTENVDKCYHVEAKRKLKFADADLYCNNLGGNLLTIRR